MRGRRAFKTPSPPLTMSAYREPDPPMLPANASSDRFAFWRPSDAFADELARALQGQRVLEIFAGNGLLAGLLAARGVDVLATSLLSDMDGHRHGLHHPVERLDARQAVIKHGENRDVLLMCWPTVTRAALDACELWGSARPTAYIGEFTDYGKGHLGGCATDEFFEKFKPSRRFESYSSSNIMEVACLGHLAAPAPRPRRR